MIAKLGKNKKSFSIKRFFASLFLIIFCLAAVVFLGVTNWKINERRTKLTARLNDLKAQVQALEKKNKQLKENASYIQSEDYLEQVAREKLDMKKPGEEVMVIQKESSSPETPESNDKKTWWEIIKSLWEK